MGGAKHRCWCVTIWDDPTLKVWESMKDVEYVRYQEECCPTTGKIHWQGWLKFTKQVTMKRVKEILGGSVHCEGMKGSEEANEAYCTKVESGTGKQFVYGELKGQGSRNDLVLSRSIVRESGKMRDVVDKAPNFQGIQIARNWLTYHESARNWKPEVWWIWGGTGTGKTKMAWELCGVDDTWISGKSLRWWDGYDAHENVIIDDFRGDFCTFHELLRILDRYPYMIEYKGGSRQLLAKKIVITCPLEPRYAYKSVEDVGQLLRRIDKIVELKCDRSVIGRAFGAPDSCQGSQSEAVEVGGNTGAPPSGTEI